MNVDLGIVLYVFVLCLCAFSDRCRQFFVASGDTEEHSGRGQVSTYPFPFGSKCVLLRAFKGADWKALLIF